MKKLILNFLIATLLLSCNSSENKKIDISNINIEPKFITFHKQFYTNSELDFEKLKHNYPYLFPKTIPDSTWINKRNSSEEIILLEKVDSVFSDFSSEKKELTDLFKRIKSIKPNFSVPKTHTLISNLDFENKVIYADSLLFISLDMYLGKDSEVYVSFPEYIKERYTKKHLSLDVATEIIKKEFRFSNGRTFLESLIFYGKEQYLKKLFLPNSKEFEVLGFSEKKHNWTVTNESQVWSYFITEELLYSTDKKLNYRFLEEAPFSKFYLASDNESPGRIGQYIGLKIIESFMNSNNVSIHKLLRLDAQQIFQKSKYKPKK